MSQGRDVWRHVARLLGDERSALWGKDKRIPAVACYGEVRVLVWRAILR